MIDTETYGQFTFDRHAKDVIELLLAPMAGSVSYAAPKGKPDASAPAAADGDGSANKRRRVSQVKQEAAAAFKSAMHMDGNVQQRQAQFGDALLNTVFGQLNGLCVDDLNLKAIRNAIQQIICYMISNKTTVGGVEYTTCSQSLHAIFDSLTNIHKEALLKVHATRFFGGLLKK